MIIDINSNVPKSDDIEEARKGTAEALLSVLAKCDERLAELEEELKSFDQGGNADDLDDVQ